MSKRVLRGLVLVLAALGGAVALAQGDGDASRGAALYAEYCLACHGPRGEARASGEAFAAAIVYDATFEEVVAQGVPATYMGPWGEAHGGPLSDEEIADLRAFVQSWTTGEAPPLPTPEVPSGLQAVGSGDPALGAALYLTNCAGCHGPQGEGRGLALYPPLSRSADFLAATRRGVPGTLMPAFASAYGGPLSEDDVSNLMAYVRTWERPSALEEAAQEVPPGAWQLVLLTGIGAILGVGLVVLVRHSETIRRS